MPSEKQILALAEKVADHLHDHLGGGKDTIPLAIDKAAQEAMQNTTGCAQYIRIWKLPWAKLAEDLPTHRAEKIKFIADRFFRDEFEDDDAFDPTDAIAELMANMELIISKLKKGGRGYAAGIAEAKGRPSKPKKPSKTTDEAETGAKAKPKKVTSCFGPDGAFEVTEKEAQRHGIDLEACQTDDESDDPLPYTGKGKGKQPKQPKQSKQSVPAAAAAAVAVKTVTTRQRRTLNTRRQKRTNPDNKKTETRTSKKPKTNPNGRN